MGQTKHEHHLQYISGTSVLNDDTNGEFKGTKIQNDDTREEIASMLDDAPYRPVDLAIAPSKKELTVAGAPVICPLIDAISQHNRQLSMLIPKLTPFAVKHAVGHMGKGPWYCRLHVNELAQAYIMHGNRLHCRVPGEPLCEDGHDTSWEAVCEIIGKAVYEACTSQNPGP